MLIEDHLWLYVGKEKLVIFISEPPKENQLCLTRVLWCSFSPDGTRLATCTSEGFVKLWNVDTCQVYQRFRCNIGSSLSACWWSDKHLFVCHFSGVIPSLSRYPVDENFMIVITQVISMPVFPVVKESLPFSRILDFSEGYISFECGQTKPVTVVDVIKTEIPKIVVLPGICPMMSIAVSAGASFVLGSGYGCFLLWKRKNDADPTVYSVHVGYRNPYSPYLSGWCFNDDLKFAVSFSPGPQNFVSIDVVSKVCEASFVYDRFITSNHCIPAKLFSANKVLVLATSKLIEVFDFKSHQRLGSFLQRYLPPHSVIHAKLSPKGTILAVPTLTDDVDFLEIRFPT